MTSGASVLADVSTPETSNGSVLWVVVAIGVVLVLAGVARFLVRRSRR